MSLVLIVEDEPVLRASMARALTRAPACEVADASTLSDALRLFEAERPDLIISDLHLPDGSGLSLLSARDRAEAQIPFVFISAYVGELLGQLPERADVTVLEKPVPIARLRSLVSEHLGQSPRPAGGPFTLVDYMQLASFGHYSVEIEVFIHGRRLGRVVMVKGQLWHAASNLATGMDALFTLVTTPGSTTDVQVLENPGLRTVHLPVEQALLEVARRQDEGAPLPPLPPMPDAPASDASARSAPPELPLDTLMEQALDALIAQDYDRARQRFESVLSRAPDHPIARANLSRLMTLGFGGP